MKINNSIYNLDKFCEIQLDIEILSIVLYIDYKQNKTIEQFNTKEECLAKWNEIYNSLH